MPCYHLRDAWLTPNKTYFHEPCLIDSVKTKLPCKQCIGCRLDYSRNWAIRLTDELRFHEKSAFITLTYADEYLPKFGSLEVKHFQDFMKRLRKKLQTKIRFFHAGEYGEKKGRPHYHAIIYGADFKQNAYKIEKSDRGDVTWMSPLLDSLWEHGQNRVGKVTFESCAYVARYVTKKITGKSSHIHYQRICEITGEITQIKKEYATMSRRPGIGYDHFLKYKKSIYMNDEVISRGHPCKPPNYYDKLLERFDPELYAEIKDERECALSLSDVFERSPQRLLVRETVKTAQISSLKRNYEIG